MKTLDKKCHLARIMVSGDYGENQAEKVRIYDNFTDFIKAQKDAKKVGGRVIDAIFMRGCETELVITYHDPYFHGDTDNFKLRRVSNSDYEYSIYDKFTEFNRRVLREVARCKTPK